MEHNLETAAQIWSQMQAKNPLVHCITNAVTVNDCANILLAAGARPTMAHHVQEVQEVTRGCDALVCNFGATDDYEAIFLAAEEASKIGHPIVVDPVGAGGSSFRRANIKELFCRAKVSCIRGNASEMRAVFEDHKTVTGVDARAEDGNDREGLLALSVEFAKKHQCICVISGEEDLVTDGREVLLVQNGHESMSKITGTGCMSSVLIGAVLAAATTRERQEHSLGAATKAESTNATRESSLWAVASAVSAMGICGEIAAEKCRQEQSGTMSFRLHLIDAMSMLGGATLLKRQKMKKI